MRFTNVSEALWQHRRLTLALLLSLLLHALLLTLTFGGQGWWLPGFGFPWQDRGIGPPDLRVVVVPPQITPAEPAVAEPSQQARVEPPLASGPALTPSVPRAPTSRRTEAAIVRKANPSQADPGADAATAAAPAQMPLRGDRPADMAPLPIPAPPVIAVARTDVDTWVVPVTPATPPPVIAAAPSTAITEPAVQSLRDAGNEARARIDREAGERAVEPKLDPSKREGQRQAEELDAAREDAAGQEAARADNARLEAERQETARQETARQETARAEAARAEAARVEAARAEAARAEAARAEAARAEAARAEAARAEAARVEAARAEAARAEAARAEAARAEAARAEAARAEAARAEAARAEAARAEAARAEAARAEAARAEAARAEAARAEAARAEAARAEAARAEAARAEAARAEAARAEAARQEAAQVEAARVDVAQDPAARREAALRAIGRQLDEEAARREAAARLPPSWSSARRYRLLGRTDPNPEIIQYAEAWARKIHVNMTFDMVREAAKQPHTDPVVMVAIRSDGSVEAVTIVQSSGVAALDEAIRRVVHSQTPYQAFPPDLAREFDVIEIRRTWYFDVAIRLY